MDIKLGYILAALFFLVFHQVSAEFNYNRILPKVEELESLDLKCIPGRTVIKIEEKSKVPSVVAGSDEDDDEIEADTRRFHTNGPAKDQNCQICVCSVEGKDEYCSNRPAMNVNECIRMTKIKEDLENNKPFGHERSLFNRIRRDYIWHNDEIPYDRHAKCLRGRSYYSNSINANDTDIDIASDIESLLDYMSDNVCFACVCAVDGYSVSCLQRDMWYCTYYKELRTTDSARAKYHDLFKQDRPTYFRDLSHRIRRTMDEGIYGLLAAVGSEQGDQKCTPFVSEYSDCSDSNKCGGCSRCSCTADGEWSCKRVVECDSEEDMLASSENAMGNTEEIDNILFMLQDEIARQKKKPRASEIDDRVPEPSKHNSDIILGGDRIDRDILSLFRRPKRSVEVVDKHEVKANTNNSVKFYHTVDEINEDTLKNSNSSGTIGVNKVKAKQVPTVSRRTGVLDNSNLSALHIEYNQPQIYNRHITDNKIDSSEPHDKIDVLATEKIHKITSNYTQREKNKNLSKLIVNELKNGTEIIGDKNAPVMSNITFTPENDTLTAMALIAGNLLNKLWVMEKDSDDESVDTEVLKHERISDLLDLFKEPLTLRQETFIKNALEKLSDAVNKNKDVKNISLCSDIGELIKEEFNTSGENCDHGKKTDLDIKKKEKAATSEAIEKINTVLNLVNKFESVQKTIDNLNLDQKGFKGINESIKNNHKISTRTDKENSSFDMFGNLLEKITKLLVPNKKNKQIINKIKKQHLFDNADNTVSKVKELYNVDLGNFTITAKDKLVLDYLTKIQRSPNCLLGGSIIHGNSNPLNIEGDILLNLSEFFKIKSFIDLLKLLGIEKKQIETKIGKHRDPIIQRTSDNNNNINNNNTNIKGKVKDDHDNPKDFTKTKERLKAHLKTILDDLIEMQKERGLPAKDGDIKIADVLPCIYKMLNSDKKPYENLLREESHVTPMEKVKAVFDSIKNNRNITTTRRGSDLDNGPIPHSSRVWERVIRYFEDKQHEVNRRSGGEPPMPFDEIKKRIEHIESDSSSTYKNYALLGNVPASERLILLKTLEVDVKKYMKILEEIQEFVNTLMVLPRDEQKDIKEFIDNALLSINLDSKVAKKLVQSKENRRFFVNMYKEKSDKQSPANAKLKMEPSQLGIPSLYINNNNKNLKFSKDQVLSQLMKNRVKMYLKLKEARGISTYDNINYNIAKKVLDYIENGNIDLAKELYKVFVSRKIQNLEKESNDRIADPLPSSANRNSNINLVFTVNPSKQFEQESALNNPSRRSSHDHLLKQLMNIKDMRVK